MFNVITYLSKKLFNGEYRNLYRATVATNTN